jgi:hypothetical protein
MLPTDHEKFMVSALVARNGLGGVCTDRDSAADVQRLARDLLVDPRGAQAARSVAARHENLREQAAMAIRESLCGAARDSAKRQPVEQ